MRGFADKLHRMSMREREGSGNTNSWRIPCKDRAAIERSRENCEKGILLGGMWVIEFFCIEITPALEVKGNLRTQEPYFTGDTNYGQQKTWLGAQTVNDLESSIICYCVFKCMPCNQVLH